MSTENETAVLAEIFGKVITPAHIDPQLFGAARVEKGAPEAYRLARYRTDDGAIELKLQGCYLWWQGSDVGYEWRDIPTVDLTETQP